MVVARGDGSESSDERALLEEAVVDLMVEWGYKQMTVDVVAARAGLAPETFERHFASLDDAVLATFRRYAEEFNTVLREAFEREESWRDSLRAAAYAAARYVRDHPRVARFGTVQLFEAGLMAQAERESRLHEMVDLIDAGRRELDDPDSIGRGVAEGVLGSVYGSLVREIRAGRGTRTAEDFVPGLMYIAVRPYLGHEAAREELTIPAPPERGADKGEEGPLEPSGTETEQPVHEADRSSYGQSVSEAGQGDEAALRLARLPPGRHGLPREFVTQNQRDRLAAGMIAVVAERGLNDATITQICAAAGVSRRTFYAYFSSKQECFFATYGTIVDHLQLATDAAAAQEDEWPRRVGAKLGATLEFLAVNPDLVKFLLVAPQRAGEEVAGRYRAAMERAVEYLCEGKPPPPATKAPSDAVAASLIGGMVALAVRKVNAGEGDDLPRLLPNLLELFLSPYLGRSEAARVASGSL